MTDEEKKEYMDCIKQHPKFIPNGTLDEDFFYTQKDGSKFGFFDPEGFYFNPEGFDDVGGYYDTYGVYHDADYDVCDEPKPAEEDTTYQEYLAAQHVEPQIAAIQNADGDPALVAVLGNLPYKANKTQIEEELKKHNIDYQEVKTKLGQADKLISASVRVKSKEAAKMLLGLHGKQFLGRKLKVDFPDFVTDVSVGAPVAISEPAPAPEKKPTPPAKEEKKPEETKKPKPKLTEESKEINEEGFTITHITATSAEPKKEAETVDEEGFIIEHYKSTKAPFRARPKIKYRKKNP